MPEFKEINKQVLLFDGVCNLCNGVINFIIDHDPDAKFRFASLQSETGRKYLKKFNLPLDAFESFVLVDGDKFYTKSTAALKVAGELKGFVSLMSVFLTVPPVLRDVVYSFIARNRYRWFGKQDACRIPTPELKQRFLE